MARPRSELSAKIHAICNNVYFQPPTGTKLTYPCIVYKLEAMNVRFADNRPYSLYDQYEITYMTRDPDDSAIHEIALLPMCRFSRSFTNENLYHNVYTLYH